MLKGKTDPTDTIVRSVEPTGTGILDVSRATLAQNADRFDPCLAKNTYYIRGGGGGPRIKDPFREVPWISLSYIYICVYIYIDRSIDR